MSSDAIARAGLMPVEYLAMERASAERHEYLRGEVFAMAGASREHNLIAGNIADGLRRALRDRPCEVYQSDMRVKIEATGLYTYPDVAAVCGGPRFEDAQRDTLVNPRVIFEVLSESTERYDRGRRFDQYRTVPSLAEYVLISQEERHVEHFARQADGSWTLRVYRAGDRLPLPALACDLGIDDLYARVFDAAG